MPDSDVEQIVACDGDAKVYVVIQSGEETAALCSQVFMVTQAIWLACTHR